ncbi:hypothetical protein [Maledivibacter halophilus]|nr:hypothetical protein [Maledivibacter halophilus]
MRKLHYDNYYKSGNRIIVVILEENNEIKGGKAIDYYRQCRQLIFF